MRDRSWEREVASPCNWSLDYIIVTIFIFINILTLFFSSEASLSSVSTVTSVSSATSVSSVIRETMLAAGLLTSAGNKLCLV